MQAKKVYAYIHRNGYKTKLMAAAIRNKQDVFSPTFLCCNICVLSGNPYF